MERTRPSQTRRKRGHRYPVHRGLALPEGTLLAPSPLGGEQTSALKAGWLGFRDLFFFFFRLARSGRYGWWAYAADWHGDKAPRSPRCIEAHPCAGRRLPGAGLTTAIGGRANGGRQIHADPNLLRVARCFSELIRTRASPRHTQWLAGLRACGQAGQLARHAFGSMRSALCLGGKREERRRRSRCRFTKRGLR